jgi:saccharopine dehydrogenase-like NADP-dependent oxidoreductase
MAALTGVPLAIGAKMLAGGEIEARGVVAPEACVPPDRFLDELGSRGIPVYEMGVDRAVNTDAALAPS